MAVRLNKVRIQQFLVAFTKAGTFPSILYAAGMAQQPEDASVAPASVTCNETGSDWAIDDRDGRKLSQTRTNWNFEVRVAWDKEVSLELFEQAWAESPPLIAKDDPNYPGDKNLHLFLVSIQVTHPVEQGGPKGTKAVLTIQATPLRN